ncbi:MAG TPA: SCP2 sterol-binding domain-containing protein [Ilumatobacteraceae bacterium]|nr:SCP2 sterol-binding domain-containing protein [Ilumatobacteraceae bacterium]
MAFQFLSDAWMVEARAIRAKYEGEVPPVTQSIRINLVITDAPFGDDETASQVDAFIDTSGGSMVMDLGTLDQPDTTITTDYPTAKALFVDQDAAAAMQAFMAGKIRVQGDMTKMMALSTAVPASEATQQIAEEIKAITAD